MNKKLNEQNPFFQNLTQIFSDKKKGNIINQIKRKQFLKS